jgi:hypothetical protein
VEASLFYVSMKPMTERKGTCHASNALPLIQEAQQDDFVIIFIF